MGASVFVVLSKMPASSQFYVHYSGFGGLLLFNFFAQGQTPLNTVLLIHQPPIHPFRKITAGRNGLYVELPVTDDSIEDEGDFLCLMFVHHDVRRRKRLDIFLSPSQQPRHIHARLTANETEILFEGEVPFSDDNKDKPPFILDAPQVA